MSLKYQRTNSYGISKQQTISIDTTYASISAADPNFAALYNLSSAKCNERLTSILVIRINYVPIYLWCKI